MTYEFDASEYEQDDDLLSEPEQDDDMEEYWRDAGMPAAATLKFSYQSSAGTSTQRTVDVREFAEGFFGPQLRGHCQLRNATRTFNIDSISDCVDLQTGEQVEDVAGHLFELYKKTPEHSFDAVVAEHLDKLRALLYVMQFSGHELPQRVHVLLAICRKLSGDDRISTRQVAGLVVQYRRESIQAFRLMIGRLNKQLTAAEKAALIQLATRIATHFEPTNKFSQEALDYMVKRFAKDE